MRNANKRIEFTIRIFFGTLKVPLEHIIGTSLHDLVEGDMNNGKCMTTLFWRYKTRTDHHDYTNVNLHAKCFHNGIHYTLYPYEEDFPPDAIINKNWFDDNPSGKTRYSLVQVTFENINTTLSPLQVHCSVDIEDRPTFSEMFWIDYIGCPTGKYGFKCHKPCICKNEAKCSVFNGACKCTSGWHGPACDIPKASIMMVPQRSESQYGYFMILTCSSENIDLPKTKDEWKKSITWYHDEKYLHLKNKTHAIYIHQEFPGISHLQIKWVTEMTEGAYECHIMDKYNKKYIATATVIAKCPVNRFGRYCNESCDCLTYSSTSCDRYDGCICKQGWNGTRCQHDLIPPVILRCPKDITQYTESGKAYTNVTWLVPAVEDNSDDVILFSNHNPGDVFQEGTTLVRYTATDSSNNTHHCRFKIHVIKSKEFDAMVLYSSKDEDFAEDIAARLEENKSLKLLLHERDFPVGGGILENIIEAFEKSRASILILSQAFLESGYCMHEAEIALDSWITKRRKLIPIFKESIERKKIPAVIDDIMSSITYFEWHRVQTEQDEDKFWNKLQRALTKPNRKSSLVSSVRKTIVRLFGQNGAVSYTRLNNQVV
ncbi:uncharacterized protein [Ptychodera flava]|uniref:uncharacterized protein isoform X2 n=1 Tax=Ptychodera flava TaxID=63121 RepID=UPI00396AAD32